MAILGNMGRSCLCAACAFGLILANGCERDSDTAGVDDYFAANPYTSEYRDTPASAQLRITPSLAAIGIVGQQVVFTASGGDGEYSWSVTDKSVGTVHSLRTSQCFYTCHRPGNNTVKVTDRNGHWATARVTPATDSMTLSPASVSMDVSDESKYASFAVSGGTPPYTWSVGNPSLGTISYSSANSYQSAYTAFARRYGVNTITVRDGDGRTATAQVIQTE